MAECQYRFRPALISVSARYAHSSLKMLRYTHKSISHIRDIFYCMVVKSRSYLDFLFF